MFDKALELLADSLMLLTAAGWGSLMTVYILSSQPKSVDKCYPKVTQTNENAIFLGNSMLEIEMDDLRRTS